MTQLTLDFAERRVLLMGCVAGKRDRKSAAADLYKSGLWTMRREHAELRELADGVEWGILSAKHGIVLPEDTIKPYDQTIQAIVDSAVSMSGRKHVGWQARVIRGLLRLVGKEPRGVELPFGGWLDNGWQPLPCVLEVHAGVDYVSMLRVALGHEWFDEIVTVETPLRGLGIGQQRGWYARQRMELEAQLGLEAA